MSKNHPTTDLSSSLQISQRGKRPSWGRFALFFFPMLIGVGVDLVTKAYMFTYYFQPSRADSNSIEYGPQFPHWWVEGIFGIQTSTNPGALFGLGAGYSWLFALLSVIALLGIFSWLRWGGGFQDRWLTFTTGMISGGILGNLYDRIGLGYSPEFPESIKTNVRDWILFRLEGVPFFDPWPNFNIADSLLVVGACMLAIHAFMVPIEEGEEGANEQSKTT